MYDSSLLWWQKWLKRCRRAQTRKRKKSRALNANLELRWKIRTPICQLVNPDNYGWDISPSIDYTHGTLRYGDRAFKQTQIFLWTLNQGSPTTATQQEVSSGGASEASSAAPHCSHYHLNHPPNPWKNCLPWNWSLVPKRLGTAALNRQIPLGLLYQTDTSSPHFFFVCLFWFLFSFLFSLLLALINS